ncbi:MAG: hypothetical protein NZL83_02425 [Candidatus Absconditabacterales bacterium]|nr:hypothetical protein [Candidatus Absconditabacterales bacterium]
MSAHDHSLSDELHAKASELTKKIESHTKPFEDKWKKISHTAAGKTKAITKTSHKVIKRCLKNRDILVGVPVLTYGMYILLPFIYGLSFIIVGLLLILGYIKKWMRNGWDFDNQDIISHKNSSNQAK